MLAYYLLLVVNRSPLRWRNRVRDVIFSSFSSALSDLDVYREWQLAEQYFSNLNDKKFIQVQLSNIDPKIELDKKIAIHFHIYYIDLAKDALRYFEQFPVNFDLLISCTTSEDAKYCISVFKNCPTIANIQVKVVHNRGRDLAPLFCDFGPIIEQYDYFAHIHTKKSLGVNSIGDDWRKYLFKNLLSPQTIPQILTLLQSYSIVYPKTYDQISYEDCVWGMSYDRACHLSAKMGLEQPMDGYVHFPVGSMFWAQTKSFKPLFALSLSIEDFELELQQSNGTLAHCIERLLATVPTQNADPAAIFS